MDCCISVQKVVSNTYTVMLNAKSQNPGVVSLQKLCDGLGIGSVKSYAQNCFWYQVEFYYGGGLTAPWLLFSRQGAKGQGRRYAARLALDAL